MIAGTGSGVGKTTITAALAHHLTQQGLNVAVFKCGPDYLDPTYHQLATAKTCHNLDSWIMGKDALIETFAETSQGADIALLEGVMGLYDGASPSNDSGSSAQIAKCLQCPVLLVIDAKGVARSAAAMILGFDKFDTELQLAAAIANRCIELDIQVCFVLDG